MILVSGLAKSFRIPKAHKRTVRESLFSFFDRSGSQEHQVLKDFSLEIQSGEWVGLMGPNGSGKSTLMKILAGIYQPDAGEIRVDGKLASVLELGTGFNPELSARDNIFLHGALLGLSQKHLQRRVSSILEYAGVSEFAETPLKHFSSGMTSRLAFAIAMEVEADVYLFDEVLAVGDEDFQKKCAQAFADLKKENKTALLVSHSREVLEQYCDRILEM
jgi:ABC-type polysaccharide/polyol phosphate transport system ATPase subunit